MSLKARLRLSVVALVTTVVIALSAVYLYDFTLSAFQAAEMRADFIAGQVKYYVLERIDRGSAAGTIAASNLDDYGRLWTDIVRTDPLIQPMLARTVANADVVLDIQVLDASGNILVSGTDRATPLHTKRVDFAAVEKRHPFLNLWDLFRAGENYARTVPIGVQGQPRPVFQVAVIIRSSLLRNAVAPIFRKFAIAFACALTGSMLLAFFLPTLVLNPLKRLSRHIDEIASGKAEAFLPEPKAEASEFAAVQNQLSLLGQQFRGAKQDVSSLRTNIEEMLQRLEEVVFLFDASGFLIMAGQPGERLLGKSREELIGRPIEELFPPSTGLGAVIENAVVNNQPVRGHLITMDRNGSGRARLLVNVERFPQGGDQSGCGTIVTLRDAETRRQLELQLDVAHRLTAISRLTGSVAHEIKNPLNAIALHLELLRNELDEANPEVDVISREIKRLDHVVKTFLNFNKPIEVKASPLDLSMLARDVVQLIGPDARAKGVVLESDLDEPHWINGDADLIRQAVLNVIVNGIEAAGSGGRLLVETRESDDDCLVRISDNGPGIRPEDRDKIFNLYYTTKKNGSGMGLSMTFRVVQLHSGSIDLTSDRGQGASFSLRFPSLSSFQGPPVSRFAHR